MRIVIIFPILNGPSKGSQQGEGGSQAPTTLGNATKALVVKGIEGLTYYPSMWRL